MKKEGKIALIIILLTIVSLYIIRLVNPTEIDDVSPEISCPEMQNYKIDALYIIPNYNNIPISQNKTWCEYILSLNKTLELHGINHQPYREFFYENITQEDLTFALNEFQKCFNQTPEKFKPPQLKISEKNKELILNNNLKIKTQLSQFTHKVYHCNNAGKINNKLIKMF